VFTYFFYHQKSNFLFLLTTLELH